MARLTSPDGTTVSVDDAKVDGLVARGFKKAEAKSAPKKATSSNDEK